MPGPLLTTPIRRGRAAAVAVACAAWIASPSGAFAQTPPSRDWADSYSSGGECYCASSFDHGAGDFPIQTPAGTRSSHEVCAALGPGPGIGANPVYNDLQCGNGPPNDAGDEGPCPGRVDMGPVGCSITGPRWNLERAFGGAPAASSDPATEATSPPEISFEAVAAGNTSMADLQAAATQGIYPSDMADVRGEQSCLTFPQKADSNVTDADWEAALPARSTLHYWSGFTENAQITDTGELRMRLDPHQSGSTWVNAGIDLDEPTRVITLTQTLMVEPGWDPGNSRNAGKIGFGVAAGSRPSGGSTNYDGWTVRIMWRDGDSGTDPERPDHPHWALYMYNADRTQNGDNGDDLALQGYEITPGEYVNITFEVSGNSAPGVSDGWIRGYVNGRLAAERDGIMWTKDGDIEDTKVWQISESTFHGGNDPSYSPAGSNHVRVTGVCWAAGEAGARLTDPVKSFTPFEASARTASDAGLVGLEAARDALAELSDASETPAPTGPAETGAGQVSMVGDAGFGVGTCAVEASGRSLAEARAAFSSECPMHPRVDCDPLPGGDGWSCSSQQIGSGAPPSAAPPANAQAASAWRQAGSPAPSGATTSPALPGIVAGVNIPSSSLPSPPSLGTPTGSPIRVGLDALESAAGEGWTRTAQGLEWTGPDRFGSRGADGDLCVTVDVPADGRYRFDASLLAARTTVPDEPPNDVWVRFGDMDDWVKAYVPKNSAEGRFQSGPTGEHAGQHSRALLEADVAAGSNEVCISGRSRGNVVEWIALEPLDAAPSAVPTASPGPAPVLASGACYTGSGAGGGSSGAGDASGRSAGGGQDLIAIHHDNDGDYDDQQAIVAERMVLDAYPGRAVIAVHGTRKIGNNTLGGSLENLRRNFPGALDNVGDPAGARRRSADAWQATLEAGGRVYVAEGGTSDFTAGVLTELESRGVGALDNVVVVQHSSGSGGWNEVNTDSGNLATVKRLASYTPIPDGNHDGNGTADLATNNGGGAFEAAVTSSCYGESWDYAFSRVTDQNRRVDFSDTVSLLHILGVPVSEVSDPTTFLRRFGPAAT